MLAEELKPTKLKSIHCPKCGELMVKIYPWSSVNMPAGMIIPNCRKCIAQYHKERRKTMRARQIVASKGKIPFVH